ncbi:hypothetical protein Ahy_B06g083858 [Arachis hypogaea]|uniref:Uncharacterized protein n=1 Tax=Arachis hypogaea TaxID=3818 RepID=A0A444YQS2_ARAHY|nr:hypothetical protein Ahy_B06g083858 [Arachis hypogaea]
MHTPSSSIRDGHHLWEIIYLTRINVKNWEFNFKCSQNSVNFDNIRGHKRDRNEKSSLDVIVEEATKKMRGSNADN